MSDRPYSFHDKLVAAGFKHHPSPFYDDYLMEFCDDNACCSSNYRLRIMECDKFYDVVISACPSAYAGAEENWKGVNLGRIDTFEQVEGFVNVMKKFRILEAI